MSKSAHEQIFDYASASRPLRKWPPMPAKTKIVFSVSHFFVKKQRVLYEIFRIIRAKLI